MRDAGRTLAAMKSTLDSWRETANTLWLDLPPALRSPRVLYTAAAVLGLLLLLVFYQVVQNNAEQAAQQRQAARAAATTVVATLPSAPR